MAYKFQFGAARLSGSITQTDGTITALGLDNSNANATNFGDIDADSISVADAGVGLDIDGSGANTGLFSITMGDNLASGLDITEGSNSYLKFVTTNDAENITAGKSLIMNSTNFIGFNGFDSYISGSDANTICIDGKTATLFKQNDTLKATINSSGLSVSGQLSGSGNLLIGGEITGSSINLGTAAGIAGTGLENNGGTLRIAAAAAGDGLSGGGGSALAVSVDNSSIEVSSDSIQVKALGVTNAMLAGSIADSKLNQISTAGKVALSALEIDGGTDVGEALVDADLIIVDNGAGGTNRKATLTRLRTYMQDNLTLNDVDVNKTNLAARLAQYDGTETLNIGDADNDTSVVIRGNLTVNGTTTTVNSTTVNITSSLTFEGPADDHETTLAVGTPIQDISIVMPEFSSSLGAHGVKMAVLATGSTAAEYLAASKVTAAEFALLDGATSATATTVADGDRVVFNDNGTMKQVTVQDLAAYFDDEITNMGNLVEVGALDAGSITSGFGAIDNGDSNITTGGTLKIDVDGSAINAAGSLTLGAGNDAAIYFDGADLRIDTASGADISFRAAGTELASLDETGLDLAAGDAYKIGTTSVLNSTTLGSNVVNSSLTSLGTIASLVATTADINDGTVDAVIGGTTPKAGTFTTLDCNDGAFSIANLDIDGATGMTDDLVDADLFIVDDGAGGTNKKATLGELRAYLQDNLSSNFGRKLPGGSTIVTSDVTVSNELTLVNTSGGAVALTMPDITDSVLGKVFVIKDMGNNAQGNNITINDSSSGHLIDGAQSIKIESNRGAVNLIACKNGGTFFYSIF